MSHLSNDQLAELREELRRQLHRLERSMKVTEEAARPVELDQTSVGRLSRMDAIQNQHLTKNLKERGEVRLALLEDALSRLEAGGYGQCSQCESEVGFERLLVFPETPLCGNCGSRRSGA